MYSTIISYLPVAGKGISKIMDLAIDLCESYVEDVYVFIDYITIYYSKCGLLEGITDITLYEANKKMIHM